MNRKNSLKEIYKEVDNGDSNEKLKRLPSFPRIIEFELTNHCNFRCLMCKTGVCGGGVSARKKGYMQDEVFKRILDEIASGDKKIALKFVGQGEPLLHPNALYYIEDAKKRGIICHLTTNGSMLNLEIMKKMIDIELDSIKFSFQGVDKNGYFTLRRKDNFDSLLEKISTLYKMRNDRHYPYITIGTSVTNENNGAIEEFRKNSECICDNLEVGITTLEFIDIEKIEDNQTKLELLELQKNQNRIKKRYKCCPQVFDVIAVRWNGDITACCADLDGEMTLGNIMDISIEEAWNSNKEKGYRKILAAAEYEKLPVCKNCYDVYGWTYGENNF